MALSQGMSSSINIPPNSIPLTCNTRPTPSTTMPTTQTWRISHALTLVSNPIKRERPRIEYAHFTDEFHMKHKQKLDEVRHAFSIVGEDSLEGLDLIDAVQRLGIDYHFHEQIDTVLQRHFTKNTHTPVDKLNDLYEVSLRFRLLRQEGYYVSSGVFNKFKDKDGMFKQELKHDIKGLIGLYEASQLSIEEDDVLEEAANFSSQTLYSLLKNLDDH